MKRVCVDIAVIGAGPAGLAAALEAHRHGAPRVLLIERDAELGGILQQCVHDGFGLHRFGRRMSGSQYAQAFIDELETSGVGVKLDTMVLEVTEDRKIYACNRSEGMLEIEAGAIILAMGCRERTASQALICGDRPAGVLTAGAVQRCINMEGYLPGSRAVILGSGDIGLIMARRMTLEGIEVRAVYELMPSPGGLARNIAQCLDEFNIPLHLSTTVTRVNGRKRVESVAVARVDHNLKPIPGTEETVECDLLVLAVGLIPENELSRGAGAALDPRTKGPVLDDAFMTSVPGIFACGNVAVVFDLVDYVSESAEIAARGAIGFISGKLCAKPQYFPVEAGENVGFVVPQRLRSGCAGARLFLRVKAPLSQAVLSCESGGAVLMQKRLRHLAPPEMISLDLTGSIGAPVAVSIREVSE